MLNKRSVAMFVVVALLMVTAFIVTATTPVRSSGAVAPVNSSSQPSGYIPITSNQSDRSDYYLRHPGSASPANTVASDWFERHPESLKAGNTVDLSDYYQRHPGVGLP